MYKYLVLSISCFLFCALALGAQAQDNSRSALADMLQKGQFYTLDNGLRVILYKRGTAPVFAGAVGIRVGGVNEVIGDTGISHLLEHMAFKGTVSVGSKNYQREQALLKDLEEIVAQGLKEEALSPEQKAKKQAILEELKKIWIPSEFVREYKRQGSSGMNATTGKELTRYFVNLPRSAFEFWCKMEADRIVNPVMRQFYQERDVVMEERRMRYEDHPGGKMYEKLLGVVYLNHPYRNPVIGYPFDIKKLTADRVKAFMEKYYVPSNMVISVVGDIDPDRDIKLIDKYFGVLATAPKPIHPKIVEPKQVGERKIVLKLNSSPEVGIVYRKPNYPHEDSPALNVLAEILAGTNVSPFYVSLVKKKQLAVDLGYFEAPGKAYPNFIMFSASIKRPHNTKEFVKAFDKELARIKARGVTKKQLDMAKKNIAVAYLKELKSNMALALKFVSSELLYDDWQARLQWYDKIMQVKRTDVNRVLKQYLVNDNRTLGLIESKG